MLIGSITILCFLILMAMGLHIFIVFFVAGFAVTAVVMGLDPAIAMIGQTLYHGMATHTYAVLPLFILMGSFAARAGFAKDAFDVAYVWMGRVPGSIGVATCWANAAFGAVSGSSLAAAAVFGRVAYPEMKRLNYDKSFALGCIASAGTFAAMIPPSGVLIILAIITDQSIGTLFMAGVVPGLVTAAVYSFSIIYRAKRNPTLAPSAVDAPRYTLWEKIRVTWKLWPIALLATVVLGGIYSGVFTAEEAAAAGTLLTFIIGIFRGSLGNVSELKESLKEGARTSAMIFAIMVGALYFGRVLGITRLPTDLASLIIAKKIGAIPVTIFILIILFFLGMFMNASAFFLFSFPIFYPVVVKLGVNPVWFCIICMKMAEIGAVTPPVGLNVYSLKGVVGKDATLEEIFKGIVPFIWADVAVIVLLYLFPAIATWLPNLYMSKG
jgi:C4-dicarboxylate transporter DctM subunit